MKDKILAQLNPACPWRTIFWYDTIDSTNTAAKLLAKQGAAHGTILIADCQTGGRGRMGREFVSQAGMGIYLSVILRPEYPPDRLMHLTCAVAVAVCDAIEQVTGLRPGVKWINDLVYEKRKLGGILTELSLDTAMGLTEYAVIGIGINCAQARENFPPTLQDLAGSIAIATGKTVDRTVLAGAMINALWQMDKTLLTARDAILDRYRADCVTLGQPVCVHKANAVLYGTALDVNSDGGLVVRLEDGSIRTVNSGEVSIRGMYGYI